MSPRDRLESLGLHALVAHLLELDEQEHQRRSRE
ncbi:MAG: hypothetical protein ACJAZO_004695 [Myxococcota bacterium]|jgi:hypothetical protein